MENLEIVDNNSNLIEQYLPKLKVEKYKSETISRYNSLINNAIKEYGIKGIQGVRKTEQEYIYYRLIALNRLLREELISDKSIFADKIEIEVRIKEIRQQIQLFRLRNIPELRDDIKIIDLFNKELSYKFAYKTKDKINDDTIDRSIILRDCVWEILDKYFDEIDFFKQKLSKEDKEFWRKIAYRELVININLKYIDKAYQALYYIPYLNSATHSKSLEAFNHIDKRISQIFTLLRQNKINGKEEKEKVKKPKKEPKVPEPNLDLLREYMNLYTKSKESIKATPLYKDYLKWMAKFYPNEPVFKDVVPFGKQLRENGLNIPYCLNKGYMVELKEPATW